MKRNLLNLFFAFALSSAIVACKEEEPPPDHPIVGIWELDAALLSNLPVGYRNYEGVPLTADDLIGDGDPNTTERFVYEFKNDNTYKRTLFLTGPNDVENGTWIIEEDNLTLTPDDDTFDTEFTIVGEIEESEMTISAADRFNLLSDDFTNNFDTLTNYTFVDGPDDNNNGVADRWEELQEAHSAVVDLDLWFIFER